MALFNWLKPQKPVGFTYRPRFYHEEKTELEKKLKEARESRGGDPEKIKERIRRDLRRKSGYRADRTFRQKQLFRSNVMLIVIIVGLAIITYAVLELYLPSIIKYFE